MNKLSPAFCFAFIFSGCNGDTLEDTSEPSDTADSEINETQLVAGDSKWDYETTDVVATTTCDNWAFDCSEPNTNCFLDISGADNSSFSFMNTAFDCTLSGDDFTCTGVYGQEVDAFGDGTAMVMTDTVDPFGAILSPTELNMNLPISMDCEGDGCGPVSDYHGGLPCEISLDITATLIEG